MYVSKSLEQRISWSTVWQVNNSTSKRNFNVYYYEGRILIQYCTCMYESSRKLSSTKQVLSLYERLKVFYERLTNFQSLLTLLSMILRICTLIKTSMSSFEVKYNLLHTQDALYCLGSFIMVSRFLLLGLCIWSEWCNRLPSDEMVLSDWKRSTGRVPEIFVTVYRMNRSTGNQRDPQHRHNKTSGYSSTGHLYPYGRGQRRINFNPLCPWLVVLQQLWKCEEPSFME